MLYTEYEIGIYGANADTDIREQKNSVIQQISQYCVYI